ncbi:MAG: hypothetical protein CUN55_03300 [Phototrophicales bacterium]|nr:MAG: hypothetical protein CUN55_03300 [Phototrophicales bacterium]
MYTQNEILFPHYAIAAIRDVRGPQWRNFIDHILALPETHEASLAFMLLMIRLNNCLECETDSYRAMRGCEACAIQTLRRYKGDDEELIQLYEKALEDVRIQIAPTIVHDDQEFV